MKHLPRADRRFLPAATALALLAGAATAQDLIPEWVTPIDVGTSLSAGLGDAFVDASGVSYLAGTAGGPSGYTDTIGAVIEPDGQVRWTREYNGPVDWHDQGRAVALAPGGRMYITGNTPSPTYRARVLLLEYDLATGDLLSDTSYASSPLYAEAGHDLVVEDDGEVIVGGGTNGDGSDALLVKFDTAHEVAWMTTWDGPAWGPYSQDSVQELAIHPDGNIIMRPHGVMADLQPDFVLIKYDPADGAIIWEGNYGTRAGEYANAMVMDDAGDLYITGSGQGGAAFFTVKVDGMTGAELWRADDQYGIDDHARAIALDGEGGVYITGDADVDGDESNFNDVIYAVKRDAETGAFRWDFVYGETCKRCYDIPSDIEVDAAGNLLLMGSTSSPPYGGDTILFRLDRETGAELERGTTQAAPAGNMWFDARRDIFITTGVRNATTGQGEMIVWKLAGPGRQGGGCPADCDGDGLLSFFDFLCFQNLFAAGDPAADCDGDGSLTFFDFLCFQNQFAAGCA